MSPQSIASAGLLLVLLPAAYFLSVLSPTSTRPNALIYLAYVGAVLLTIGLVVLDNGLLSCVFREIEK